MSATQAGLSPIVHSVVVAALPEQAFALFTGAMGKWWPVGGGIGASPHEDIIIEPRAGGRWFERGQDGSHCDWGKVLAWEPPRRVLLAWQLDARFAFDPGLVTEVELTFEPEGEGRTRVTLRHGNLDRLGPTAAALAKSLDGGWASRMKNFADYAAAHLK